MATGARAHRLLFAAGQCTGVEYRQDGAGHIVYADREVILSAGTVDSPRLLLLSGVGTVADLERAGVDVVHDLPGVGRNLHDHPLCNVVYEAARPIPPGKTNHAETSMVSRSDPSLTGPDMQLMFMHVPFGPPALPAPPNSFTFGLATVPQARGAVRIAGPDPSAPPLIDPNYLGAERDVLRLVDAVAVAREIAAAHPFDAWRGKELHPGPEARDQQSLREFVTRATGTYFHPVGTCAMGTGPDAVVDPDLRLRGVRGLRVADASVMPRIVCVNTNAATIMIGEKAADLVRGREVAGSVS
ncbi:GMC oxidoreductase [Amycolatopsis sp. NPDC051372]|uniref:GMC family oxidoreductase n=1 Tax=unclassified Amycolatopsis TaxID=2618356 RepID=UPI003425B5B6